MASSHAGTSRPSESKRLLATFEHRSFWSRWTTYAALPAITFALAFALGLSSDTISTTPLTSAEGFMPGASMSALEIFRHNARLLVLLLGGGIVTFSVGGLLLLLVNGANIGSSVAFFASSYGYETALVGVFPHGILEIFAYVLAAAVAFRVSVLVLAWQLGGVRPFDRRNVGELVAASCLSIGLLAVAAVIETSLSPVLVTIFA